MERGQEVAWRLLDNGRRLEIMRINGRTKQVESVSTMRLNRCWTEADAEKYVSSNYPSGVSSVELAAETLGRRRLG